MSNNKAEIIIPGPEEDAVINAGMADDPDTFELSDDWLSDAKPSHEAIPHILERHRQSRGKQKEPTKTAIHIRLDADIVDWFKNGVDGERGYQTRINRALREYISRQDNAGDCQPIDDHPTE